MTCSAEFPCHSSLYNEAGETLQSTPGSLTIPAPPPEDDGSTLHTLTLDVARQTIEVLKEREAEHLKGIRYLEQRVANLEAELYSRGSERR